MQLTRFTSVDAFYQRAAPYLLTYEAEHNLILGLCVDLVQTPERYPEPPYLAVVEHAGEVVLAALMTPPYRLQLSLCAQPAALDLVVEDVAAFGMLPGVAGSAEVSGMFARNWEHAGRGAARKTMALRIYKLTEVRFPQHVSGHMRRATERDRALLVEWFAGFDRDAMGVTNPQQIEVRVRSFLRSATRGLFLWEDEGQPMAMAGFSGPTPNSLRVNAVYTPPEHRRRGYASMLVATLSQHLLDKGRQFCTLYTDLANPTSNHIYQEVGYCPVINVDEWTFEQENE